MATKLKDLQPGDLLTDTEAAALLHTAVRTLRNWRCNGQGPRWLKIGTRTVRYHRDDLAAFIAASNTEEAA